MDKLRKKTLVFECLNCNMGSSCSSVSNQRNFSMDNGYLPIQNVFDDNGVASLATIEGVSPKLRQPDMVLSSSLSVEHASLATSINSTNSTSSVEVSNSRKISEEESKVSENPVIACPFLLGNYKTYQPPPSKVLQLVFLGSEEDIQSFLCEDFVYKIRTYCANIDYKLEFLDFNCIYLLLGGEKELCDFWNTNKLKNKTLIIIFKHKITTGLPSVISQEVFQRVFTQVNEEQRRIMLMCYKAGQSPDTHLYNLDIPNVESANQLLEIFTEFRFLHSVTESFISKVVEGEIFSPYILLVDKHDDDHERTDDRPNNDTPDTQLWIKFKLSLEQKNIIEHSNNEIDIRSEFNDKFENIITRMISVITDQDEIQPDFLKGIRIKDRLKSELEIQAAHFKELTEMSTLEPHNDITNKLLEYVYDDTPYPVILHGDIGSGKSCVISQLAELITSRSEKPTMIVLRYLDLYRRTFCVRSLIDSIHQQLKLSFNIKHSSVLMEIPANNMLNTLLNDVSNSELLVVIILDDVDNLSEEDDLMKWLPDELPLNIKLILTTSNTTFMQTTSNNTVQFVHLQPINIQCGQSLMVKYMNNYGLTFSDDEESSILFKCHQPLYLFVLSSVQRLKAASETLDIKHLPETVEALLCVYWSTLENRFGRTITSNVIMCICSAQNGISISEICNLLLLSSHKLDSVSALPGTYSSIWLLLHFLKPLFNVIEDSSGVYYKWAHHVYVLSANVYLQKSSINITTNRYYHSDYNRKTRNCKIRQLNDILLQKREINGTHKEIYRSISELPYYRLTCENIGEFIETYLFDITWLSAKCRISGVTSILEDIEHTIQYCQEQSLIHELLCLSQLLILSKTALETNSQEIYTQFMMRLGCLKPLWHDQETINSTKKDFKGYLTSVKKFVYIKRLYEDCCEAPVPYLFSDTPCLRDIVSTFSSDKHTEITGLYQCKNQHECLVGLLKDKNQIKLFCSENGECYKIIEDIKKPSDLCYLTCDKALVLCQRELAVVNFTSNQEEQTLKGVLNLERPLFGVQDENHVIVLSRNRMSINVFDLNSGDNLTTFKVGEDRFLDSLVISESGEVLVCGDKSQKPYRLLVWNLVEQRLVHDIRLHNHVIDMSLINVSADGQYIVCTCEELDHPNSVHLLVFEIISGQLFKKWKCSHSVTSLKISCADNTIATTYSNGYLIIWDIFLGNCKFEVKGTGVLSNRMCLSTDGINCLTYYQGHETIGNNSTITLWNAKEGKMVATFTMDSMISCCLLSLDGTRIFVCDNDEYIHVLTLKQPQKMLRVRETNITR